MAEHSEPSRKPAPAASAAHEPAPVSGAHAELLNRRSESMLGSASRLLGNRTDAARPQPIQRAGAATPPNRTGLPDSLKQGVEALSGVAMDDVRVHRNSSRPAALGAHAFAQGPDIHLAPGQERHLPHEAWHVVQQKQGRVRATVQLKGVGLNDDQGLEREADAMGARAAALGPPQGPVPAMAAGTVAGTTVQAKLAYIGHVLTKENYANNPLPERLKPYDQAELVYHIREDWDLKWTDVHLIHSDHVYLLGEIHGSGTWAKQTAEWKHINKMHEDLKALPGVQPEGAGKLSQPLESLHAYLLHICLGAKSQAVNLAASKTGATLPILKAISHAGGQVEAAIPTYAKWVNALPKGPQSKVEVDFLVAFVKLGSNASIVKTIANTMITDLENKAPDAAVKDRIKTGNELLADEVKCFALLAAELAKVMKIAPGSVSGKAIDAEIKSKAPVAIKDSAAMGPREDAMVTNINAATRPLLVQIGDGHVESVGAKVAKSVKLRVGNTLDQVTKV